MSNELKAVARNLQITLQYGMCIKINKKKMLFLFLAFCAAKKKLDACIIFRYFVLEQQI